MINTNVISLKKTLFMLSLLGASHSALANTYVYVSNQTDATISAYKLDTSAQARLIPIEQASAAKLVMPMAASADGKFLYAAMREKPYALYTYRINPKTGQLILADTIAMPDSMVSLGLDRTGKWLLSASYGGFTIGVHRITDTGLPEKSPRQFFKSGGKNPHSIRVDYSNSTVYVPHLGTDEIRSYAFDASRDMPMATTATSLPTKNGFGPRHSAISPNNKHVYILSELTGYINVYQREDNGELKEVQTISSQPSDTMLVPGQPRVPVGTPGAVPFDESRAVWSADIQMTPNGKFLYSSERTLSTLSQFAVDSAGRLSYLGQITTEKGPRGFAIDPSGRYVVVSGEKSPTVSLYSIDQNSGLLKYINKYPVGKGANWVTIVDVN